MHAGFIRRITAAVLAMVVGTGLSAQDAPTPLAESGLQGQIDALATQQDANPFEQGMLQSLRAIERTLQTRYDYGLGESMTGLPVLRLRLGQSNRQPKPAQPETLAEMFRVFAKDMDAARADLGRASEGAGIQAFDLALQDVWFDVNSNGIRDQGEGAVGLILPLLQGRRGLDLNALNENRLTVRFDAADHAWLMAYTHMLSGIAEMVVAFDPAPVLRDLAKQRDALANAPVIPNYYDQEALEAEIAALEAERDAIEAKRQPLQDQQKKMYDDLRALQQAEPRDKEAIDALNAEVRTLQREQITPLNRQRGFIRTELNAAKAKRDGPRQNMIEGMRPQVDAVYVLLAALRQQPDAARIKQARLHLLEMIAHNRVFWAALAEETDDVNEWIPNPRQTSALGVMVDRETGKAWQAILADAHALIDGRLLIMHPLLPRGTGISLKAYFEDPSGIDLIDWIHGIGAYRYAAQGPMISAQRWRAFQRLTGGNAGGFAIFFN